MHPHSQCSGIYNTADSTGDSVYRPKYCKRKWIKLLEGAREKRIDSRDKLIYTLHLSRFLYWNTTGSISKEILSDKTRNNKKLRTSKISTCPHTTIAIDKTKHGMFWPNMSI